MLRIQGLIVYFITRRCGVRVLHRYSRTGASNSHSDTSKLMEVFARDGCHSPEKAKVFPHPAKVIDDRAVGDHDALGFSSGARGIGPAMPVFLGECLVQAAWPGCAGPEAGNPQRSLVRFSPGAATSVRSLAWRTTPGSRVFQHEAQAVGRITRVKREAGTAGLQDCPASR